VKDLSIVREADLHKLRNDVDRVCNVGIEKETKDDSVQPGSKCVELRIRLTKLQLILR